MVEHWFGSNDKWLSNDEKVLAREVDQMNVVVENFVVITRPDESLQEVLEGLPPLLVSEDGAIDFKFIDAESDMYDVLVGAGIFKSKLDARKNWTKTGADIPTGQTLIRGIGKMKKKLCIWKEN